MNPSTGVMWMFEDAPSPWPIRLYWAGSVGLALFLPWLTRMSWVPAFVLIGVLAAILFPAYNKLGTVLRRRMACSRAKLVRKLTRSEMLLVGYRKQPDGSVTFAGIMTFNRLLEFSAETVRSEIRKSLLSLFGDTPSPDESLETVLDTVYTLVKNGRPPQQWQQGPESA